MNRVPTMNITGFKRLTALTAVLSLLVISSAAQTRTAAVSGSVDDRPRSVAAAAEGADPYFKEIYRNFFETYRLGPADEIALRVVGQPDYSIDRAQITPFGRIYHPLIGDIDVAGLTISQVNDKLTADLSQYIINPKLSVSLLAANSAKIGVIGEVTRPGILVMGGPMTVLDAVSAAGGVTDNGSKSSVTVLRQAGDGRMRTITVNVKRILQAKASGEENLRLQPGDTVIVHGNFKKAWNSVTQLVGFAYFIKILSGQ